MPIDKEELSKLYSKSMGGQARRTTRDRLNISLPRHVLDRLRGVVAVRKGGQASPLIALGLELVIALLTSDVRTTQGRAELLLAGEKLVRVSTDEVGNIIERLDVLTKGVLEGRKGK